MDAATWTPAAPHANAPQARMQKPMGRPLRDRGALRQQILTWLDQQHKPVGFRALRVAVKGDRYTIRQALAALVDAGTVVRTGQNRWLQIGLPAVMAAAAAAAQAPTPVALAPRPSPATRAKAAVQTQPKPRPDPGREAEQKALVNGWLGHIRDAFADGEWHTLREIANKLGRGPAQCYPLVAQLVVARELVKEQREGKFTYFRKTVATDVFLGPKARTVPVPAFDQAAFRHSLLSVLASGASFDTNELVRAVRGSWPQANAGIVDAAVAELVGERAVDRLSLGSTVRYRRRAVPA